MAAELLEAVVPQLLEERDEMLTVYAFPERHRKRMRSTNMIERWFRGIRQSLQGREDLSEP